MMWADLFPRCVRAGMAAAAAICIPVSLVVYFLADHGVPAGYVAVMLGLGAGGAAAAGNIVHDRIHARDRRAHHNV